MLFHVLCRKGMIFIKKGLEIYDFMYFDIKACLVDLIACKHVLEYVLKSHVMS